MRTCIIFPCPSLFNFLLQLFPQNRQTAHPQTYWFSVFSCLRTFAQAIHSTWTPPSAPPLPHFVNIHHVQLHFCKLFSSTISKYQVNSDPKKEKSHKLSQNSLAILLPQHLYATFSYNLCNNLFNVYLMLLEYRCHKAEVISATTTIIS